MQTTLNDADNPRKIKSQKKDTSRWKAVETSLNIPVHPGVSLPESPSYNIAKEFIKKKNMDNLLQGNEYSINFPVQCDLKIKEL